MATTGEATKQAAERQPLLTLRARKKVVGAAALAFMIVYSVLTIFPFYALFVRTFVGIKDATELHLWIPKQEEIPMDAEIGNLAQFYNLDLRRVKTDLGIPLTEYLPARSTLQDAAERFDIPIERIEHYFKGFYTYNGWITLLGGKEFWNALARTLVITVLSLIGLTVLSIGTGYGLSRLERADQMFIYSLYLLQMVLPPMLIILPQFVLLQWLLRLFPVYNSPGIGRHALQIIAVVLVNIKGGALSTMIFTSFISGIPKELEDAARIDGCSTTQYIYHILFPLLKVPIVSVIVIMLPQFWNHFLHPYVYLDQDNITLVPFVQLYSGLFTSSFQVVYTAIFLSVLPLVMVYLLFRRFFIEGAMAGAIKG